MASSKVKRGMGLACFLHGAGFTGSGERTLGSTAGVEATAEGRVRVLDTDMLEDISESEG